MRANIKSINATNKIANNRPSFGGFFASAIKRAYGIKDFDSLFPGHGGFMDRFDCQFIMHFAVYVLYVSFIAPPDPVERLISSASQLDPDLQLQLHRQLSRLLAVRGMTLFPGVVLPIAVGRERSVRAIQAAARGGHPFGVLLQKNADIEAPSSAELYEVGTVASIVRYLKAPDGSHHVIAQGEERFRVIEFLQEDPMLIARVERVEDPPEELLERPDIQARALALKRQAQVALELLPEKPEELERDLNSCRVNDFGLGSVRG